MNIPDGYRRLQIGEVILATDKVQHGDDISLSAIASATIGQRYGIDEGATGNNGRWFALRKISSPWIAMSERKPKDCETVLFSDKPHEISGYAQNVWIGFEDYHRNSPTGKTPTHWMPIPEAPTKPTPPPIYINESGTKREVIFSENGAVFVGCVGVSTSTMDSIIKRRQEVMKG